MWIDFNEPRFGSLVCILALDAGQCGKAVFPYARRKAESSVDARRPLEDVVEQILSALKSPPPAKHGQFMR